MLTYETFEPDTVALRTTSAILVQGPKREIRSRHHSKKKKALPPRQRLQLLYKTTIPIPHEIKVLCTAKIRDLPTHSNLLKSRSLSFLTLAPWNPRILNSGKSLPL
jgi:hypothetical protein